METNTRRKAIPTWFPFFDVRTSFVLFLLLTGALLALLGLGAPSTGLAQVNGYNQPVLPIAAPKGDPIDSGDRIEKSCTYLSRGARVHGINQIADFVSSLPNADISSPTSCFPAESTVQRTFNGHTYTLHAFSGKYVQWEVPDSWLGPAAFIPREIRQLVDITDMLYAHYVELVQGEPSGSGLLIISVNPGDPGTEGVGCVGCKGVTVSAGWVPAIKNDLQIGVPNGIIVHEMGHNFDIYHDYLGYYDDWAHAWTTVVQYYLPYYMRVGDAFGGPDDALERWVRKITVPWDALGAGASWATCVRNGGGCEANGVTANDAWGGLVLRFARLHGTSAFRRVFDYLRDYKASHPTPPDTPEAKNDLLVLALAAGAQLNIACELDTWHWEFSQAVRTQIAQNYRGQDGFCLDADGDGFSPARGDLNDHNASIHPGAIEVTNGIDDDCDGVVDDLLVTEQTDFPSDVFQAPTIGSIPLRVTGHASSVDQDAVRVRVGTSLHLKATLRSFGGLQGEFDIGSIRGGGAGWGIGSFTPNSVTNFDADVPVGADGLIIVKPGSGSSGNYEIILDGTPPRPPNPVVLATSTGANTGSIHIVARINLAPISGEQPTGIRFWANGVGFIQTLPAAQIVALDWMPPAGYCGFGISAQLLAGDHPISPVTPPSLSKSDFNGDGRPDYVLYNASTRQTAIWYLNNNIYQNGALGPTLSTGWPLIDTAYFDSDGYPDYASYNPSTHATAVWYLNNNVFVSGVYGPTLPGGWQLVATGDFNGDGHPDYVLYNPPTHQTAIWYLNNNVYMSGGYGPTLPAGWQVVGVADFNSDALPDYLLFNPSSRQSAIWYMSGRTRIGAVYGPTIATSYQLVGAADFNGNGKPDYVLFNASTRRTAIWYLNNNVYVSGTYGPTLPAGWSLVAP